MASNPKREDGDKPKKKKRSPPAKAKAPGTSDPVRKPRPHEACGTDRGPLSGGLQFTPFTLCPRCGGFVYVVRALGNETFVHREANAGGSAPICAGSKVSCDRLA